MGEIEGGCAPTITNGPARCIANHNHVLKIETDNRVTEVKWIGDVEFATAY
jgi:hypothetical protein